MVAADWASSVAPPTEDLFSEPPEQNYQSNSYEEYNKKKNGFVLCFYTATHSTVLEVIFLLQIL